MDLQSENAVKLVTAAVTPAVMISAAAILIGGVSSKHQAMSDRLRALTAEYREAATTKPRRTNIERQIVFFRKRMSYTLGAHMLLFCATGAFIATVILTCFMKIDAILICFIIGVVLLLIAVCCEILELRLANRTMSLEIVDALEEVR